MKGEEAYVRRVKAGGQSGSEDKSGEYERG